MAEVQSSNWSEAAASNNAAAPDGWPEGMARADVNNCARENMAAIKREWNRSHVTKTSTGSANAYVVTYDTAPPALVHGMLFAFKASFANTGAATVDVNSRGAKAIRRGDASTSYALLEGDIKTNQHVLCSYDSALDVMLMMSPPASLMTDTEGAAVASAATTNIWADAGRTLHITGTTTITSFGTAPHFGAWKKVIFDGALTLTHGANLNLPGAANITTAAGDMAFVYADTTTQFDVLYFRASGKAVSREGWVLLQTIPASNSATVDLETDIGSTYDDYVIIAKGVRPAAYGARLCCRLKLSSAYQTTNYYGHLTAVAASAATYAGEGMSAAGQIFISKALDNVSGASNLRFTMEFGFFGSMYPTVTWRGASIDASAGVYESATGFATNINNVAIQGVRFFMDSGNISVGTFLLYGIPK